MPLDLKKHTSGRESQKAAVRRSSCLPWRLPLKQKVPRAPLLSSVQDTALPGCHCRLLSLSPTLDTVTSPYTQCMQIITSQVLDVTLDSTFLLYNNHCLVDIPQ